MPTPADRLFAVQFRSRAERLWQLAEDFPNDGVSRLLREQAAELDAKADALDGKS